MAGEPRTVDSGLGSGMGVGGDEAHKGVASVNASDAATELAAWLRSRFKPAKRPQAALWAAGTEQDGPDIWWPTCPAVCANATLSP